MADEMELLKEWIKASKNIVFFGGAGVSTESNIPDFRSTDGLYNQEYAYPPETILSHSFYKKKPEEFFRFYRNKMLFPNAQPNAAHKALARLEQQGKLNPAGLLSRFENAEEQREAAAVFNARLKQVETKEENEKALQETIYKIRQEALNRKGKELAPTDMAGLQKLIQERRELQKLHISLD